MKWISIAASAMLAVLLFAGCGAGTADTVRLTVTSNPEETKVEILQDGTVLTPEDDGTYLLAPGEYSYKAECEGYITVKSWVFTVDDTPEQTLSVSLSPAADGMGIIYANPGINEDDFISDYIEAGNTEEPN